VLFIFSLMKVSQQTATPEQRPFMIGRNSLRTCPLNSVPVLDLIAPAAVSRHNADVTVNATFETGDATASVEKHSRLMANAGDIQIGDTSDPALLMYRDGPTVPPRWDQVDLKAVLLHVNRLKNGVPCSIRVPYCAVLPQLRRTAG